MVPIGKIGKITNGTGTEKFVRVDNDSENTGGFLIITSSSDKFDDGGDGWVENRASLEKYLSESGWEIAWRD
jgi:hypothetical protein